MMWKFAALFFIVAQLLAHSSATGVPNACCQAGITSGKEDDSSTACSTSSISAKLKNEESSRLTCVTMAKVCCQSARRAMHCSIGKQMFLSRIDCSMLPDSVQQSCCNGCQQGSMAKENGRSCQSTVGNRDEQTAFQSCCADASSITSQTTTSSPTTTTSTTTTTERVRTCSDITCDSLTKTCTQTETGPVCVCKNGFEETEDGCEPPPREEREKKTCREMSCDSKTSNCVETNDGAKCACKSGYKEKSNGEGCEDINECIEEDGPKRCREHYRGRLNYCMNFDGYYECRAQCNGPNFYEPYRFVCKDVDECKTNKHDCEQGTHECVNNIGSFHCKRVACTSGYKFVNGQCEVIDQCEGNPCGAGKYCYSYFGKRLCIDVECPNKDFYKMRTGVDITKCVKDCNSVTDPVQNRACWDTARYPSSISRYAYKYNKNIRYGIYKFNYWWDFDESSYTVQTSLLGNEYDHFHMITKRNAVDIVNDHDITGPRNYKLTLQVDIKERTYAARLVWRYHVVLFINVS